LKPLWKGKKRWFAKTGSGQTASGKLKTPMPVQNIGSKRQLVEGAGNAFFCAIVY